MLKGNKEKVSIYIIIGFIFLRFIFLQIKYGLKSNQMLLNIIKCFENSMFCIFFHSRRGAAASFHAQPTVFFSGSCYSIIVTRGLEIKNLTVGYIVTWGDLHQKEWLALFGRLQNIFIFFSGIVPQWEEGGLVVHH